MPPLPADAPDYLIALAILAYFATNWFNQRKQNAQLSEVREHVSNSHNTNLRDDIDAIAEDVREIRNHQREADRQQLDFEHRVTSFVRKNHPGEIL